MILFIFSLFLFIEKKLNQNDLKPVSIPYSISIDHMNFKDDILCETNLSQTNNSSNILKKKRCYSYNFDNKTYEYLFKGEKFEIFGSFSPHYGKFNIYLDEEKLATINQNSQKQKKCALQYSSKNLFYGRHKIEIKSIGQPFKICHFSFWPSINAIRLNGSELHFNSSNSVESFQKVTKKSSISIKCSKIWIFGSIFDQINDQILFSIDEKEIFLINDKINFKNKKFFVYETDHFQFENHKLNFQLNGNATIDCIYYLPNKKLNRKEKTNIINKLNSFNSKTQSESISKNFHSTKIHSFLFTKNSDFFNVNDQSSDFKFSQILENTQINSYTETECSEKSYNFFNYFIEKRSKFQNNKIVLLCVSIELFSVFSFLIIVIVLLMQRIYNTDGEYNNFNEYPIIIIL